MNFTFKVLIRIKCDKWTEEVIYHQFNKKRGKHDEQKREKLGIFFRSYHIFITALFTLVSHNAFAEETTPAVSVTGKFGDTITIVNGQITKVGI